MIGSIINMLSPSNLGISSGSIQSTNSNSSESRVNEHSISIFSRVTTYISTSMSSLNPSRVTAEESETVQAKPEEPKTIEPKGFNLDKPEAREIARGFDSSDYKTLTYDDKEFINNFVGSFLHPYILGFITEKTDPKDREAMIDQLIKAMPNYDESKKEEVEDLAFHAFLEKGAQGLYAQIHIRTQFEVVTPADETFKYLLSAITKALPKEFPNLKGSKETVEEKTKEALAIVNKQRADSRKEIQTELNTISKTNRPIEEKKENQRKMLKELESMGKLFFEKV